MNLTSIFQPREWTTNFKPDILAGIAVALALIPEAISFSAIAEVDPKIGLYASFIIALVTAFLGGRPAMISAATGATALLMTGLVVEHGLPYLLAATILTGVIQIVFGLVKVGGLMKFVSRAVMLGFVNALAILIFLAQLKQFVGASWVVYAMVAGALAIIYILPRFTQAVPSPLVAIIIITLISLATGSEVNTVGDMGELPQALPVFSLPAVPINLETLQIIFPYSLAIAVVGLLGSFLTANVVDELTDTEGNKNREATGLGLANVICGFFGAMAGSGMIGQSVINVKSGGRTRLSTLSAGAFLLFFILVIDKWVAQIPMAALVAVMIMVSIGTFNWSSLRNIKKIPRSETAVMLTTVVITVMTRNLAMGVIIGVALNALLFSRKLAQVVFIDTVLSPDGNERIYSVAGQIFFVSTAEFLAGFNFKEDLELVKIDLTHAHLWDQSAITALDKVVLNFRRNGAEVDLIGLNEASATLVDKLAIHDKPAIVKDLSANSKQ
ncbi:MAG: SulP family inorganic anion transporter [Cyanobacteria bacterium J083]|nr:MAG: SulP family inorganic anion transporter [Cyanobacteria bacterium J083]